MKKGFTITVICLCLLTGCSQNIVAQDAGEAGQSLSWQEYYDLGVRYLSEGNYEEAVLAFSTAIEIDPKQSLAYVGRGDAYRGSGETNEMLLAAQADYEKAIELDGTDEDVYLALADVYILLGDYDKATEVLRLGEEKVGSSERFTAKMAEIDMNSSNYSRFITENLVSEEEFAIDGTPFYELSIQSAISMLPASDIPSEIRDIVDSEGNPSMRIYTVFKDDVGGIISCEQRASSESLYRLSFWGYYNDAFTEILTGIRSIKTGDSMETVLKEIGISDSGAATLLETGLSISIGANHGLSGGYGWLETDERMTSYSGTPARMLNIYMDTCSCQMDFVEDRLASLQVWVSQ